MTREETGEGLAVVCLVHNREMTPELVTAYHLVVGDAFPDGKAFLVRVRDVLRAERFWPPPAVLLGVQETPADTAATEREAAVLYDRLSREALVYDPTASHYRGEAWVEAGYGAAVAHAYRVAGGPAAFLRARESPDEDRWVRRQFCEAYSAQRRGHVAAGALPAGNARLALPPAPATAGDARRIVGALERAAAETKRLDQAEGLSAIERLKAAAHGAPLTAREG